MNKLTKKIVAIVTTVTCAVWMMGPGVANALTASELQSLIDDLLAQIATLQSQLVELEGGTTATISGCTITSFDRALKVGMSGDDVNCLQIVLNSASDTQIAESGVGSPGSETSYFGPLTKGGVVKFQEKYASDILASWGLTVGTGFVGSTTRAKLNELLTAAPAEEEEEEGEQEEEEEQEEVSTGEATISLAAITPNAAQIALNAQNAISAKFKFTGGDEGVTITKIAIKRGGVSADADVSSIKLYDGITQLGSTQALNTNTHKATFSSLNWEIPAGEVKYLTVKVTIAAKGTATVGDSIKLGFASAADITSDGTLTGTFPLYGNAMTLAGISVGELFLATTTAPAAATVLSGATDVEIASFKLTASSTEAVDIHSLSITHVGSAAADDVSNIKLKIAGVQYGDTVVKMDAENKATFDFSDDPIGILAGSNKTIYAYCDIAAGIWTSRTVIFEVTQYTDVTVYGANSGGSIAATHADDHDFLKSTGNTMTIGQGTLTVNIDASLNPASQTYVKGTENRLFSAFKFTTGAREGVRVSKLKLKNNSGSGSATDISNITLWDGSTQIAGPASLIGSYVTFGANTVGWDDPGLFDVEKSSNKTITVRADVPTGATADNTIDLDIAAYSDIWIDGLDSQYDITQNTTNISLTSGNANTHTIGSSGALALSLSAQTPPAQTYIKGSTEQEFLRVNLTADSGEDITVTALVFDLWEGSSDACESGELTNVKVLKSDGSQYGSTVASPTTEAAFSETITVPASETVTLRVLADIPSNTGLAATGAFITMTDADDITSTGASSAAEITETGFAVTGKTMAVGEGSLSISAAATPGDQTQIIGAENVSLVGLVFTCGVAEDVRVTKVKLTGIEDSNKEITSDLSHITLYDGATALTSQLPFDTNASTVTFTASEFLNSQGFEISKGQQKIITVKAKLDSTGTATHAVALGIATTTDFAGRESTTTDVTFVGLESNTTPATDLSFGSNLGGVNYSPVGHADVKYVTLADKGTLTVADNADTPVSNIVTVGGYGVGREDVVFLKLDFTANREDIDIKSIQIDRQGSALAYDDDFISVSLWDGTTQLGYDQSLVNLGVDYSSTTFNFPAGSYWTIPAGETKVLTVKADLNGVKTADQKGVLTGDAPKLCVISGAHLDDQNNLMIDSIGVSSGKTIHAASSSDICGNEQILHQSKPTLASASLPSTVYGAKTATLYRWTVTADDKGAIGWKKVIFDVSGSITHSDETFTVGYGVTLANTASSSAIFMGTTTGGNISEMTPTILIATSTMHIYNVATGIEVEPTTTDSGFYVYNYVTDGGARVSFTAKDEEIIAAGETKTYELKGTITKAGAAGDSLSFNITKRSTATSTGTLKTVIGGGWEGGSAGYSYVTSTAPTFVWTDRSGAGATHSQSTADWSVDYKVSGLSTETLTLSK